MSHCLFCGSHIRVDLHACERCGASREMTEGTRMDAMCPRCKDVPLAPFQLGPAMLQGCATCRGSFLPTTEWDSLVDTAEQGPLPKEAAVVVPPPPGRTPSLSAYIRCPVCNVEMRRVEFGGEGGVMVDVCPTHGIWLDGGELIAVVERSRTNAATRVKVDPFAPATSTAMNVATTVGGIALEGVETVGVAVVSAGAEAALDVLIDVVGGVIAAALG